MKFIAVPLLIFIMMAQAFSSWLVVMNFNFNRDFIAKYICVNRNQPKLDCKGSCVLKKKLMQQGKQEKDNPTATRTDSSPFTLDDNSFFADFKPPAIILITSYYHTGDSGEPIDRNSLVFHPPAA